ncbi:hypothetical protein EV663_10575 [Rhodovulum bhavnagarense]|uniref:LPP20 lipoprotein n=1 Tax=Rhodovulum bhavnagarense TaxID=992286 RepID=A0A4R2RGX3_9RHOB|nr:LPP20 family lipoprotein [Rhodovulum bhavnagarense]TCP61357.1 hypothetical protein EV663_10575 [Rhodovulum bhavnagarense]
MPRFHNLLTALLLPALAGCMAMPKSASDALPADAGPGATQLAQVKDDLDGLSVQTGTRLLKTDEAAPAIRGLGFSQVSTQPGKSTNEKRLMAIRAARLDAMRDLAEQVHGIRLSGESTLRDTAMRNDLLFAQVQGEIRGARTVRITPKDGDTFEVVLELDADTVAYIVRAAKGQA